MILEELAERHNHPARLQFFIQGNNNLAMIDLVSIKGTFEPKDTAKKQPSDAIFTHKIEGYGSIWVKKLINSLSLVCIPLDRNNKMSRLEA